MLTELTEYPWPHPDDPQRQVRWNGRGFQVGSEIRPFLSYERGTSGWSDELENFEGEAAGSRHFIDRASRSWALDQLHRHLWTACPFIMDVGCSAGHFLRGLQHDFPNASVIGADYVLEPLQRLAEVLPEVPFLHFDLLTCPLPDATLDAVTLLNVLEHVPNDAAALEQVHRILKPGGIAVIELPAGPDLYDIYDELYLHQRRYRLLDLCRTVEAAGLQVIARSHLGFFIYPGFRWTKRRNQRFLKSDRATKEQIVHDNIHGSGDNLLLAALTRLELILGRRVSYPIGVRCLVTARRVD